MLYTGQKLKEIVFPLGGIGTGSIGLSGNGSLVDWEIFNRPNKGSINRYTHFAIKAEYPDGKIITKILQGDREKDLTGQYSGVRFSGFGYGPDDGTMCAFPHFRKVRFDGRFPIAKLTFEDADFPADVIMTAFNPFIPLDDFNSSLPAAFFNIKIKSKQDGIKYTVMFSVANPFEKTENIRIENNKYTAVMLKHADCDTADKTYGDMTVAVDCSDGIIQQYWYRGRWKDKVSTFWYDLNSGDIKNRTYDTPSKEDICSVGKETVIDRNEKENFFFVLSWNNPNNYNYWDPYKDENGKDITFKNYYATVFESSKDSAFYSLDNRDILYKRTKSFTDSLHLSTLDKAVTDAVSSTLSVLKSPTVLRLSDGTFYGWEGVHEKEGSCEGTCTHVWSYVYSLCFLFPELERSLRDTEFKYDTNEYGNVKFRTKLPLSRERHFDRACIDGQMATVIKIYRDLKITGNTEWVRDNWDNIKKILEYAWSENNPDEWDRDHDGVLEGRQHHTLDMELFGPSAWLEGMYLCALKAASKMAELIGDTEKAKEYSELFVKGYDFTRKNLFNGKYFIQKVDLTNKRYTDHFNAPDYWNEEKKQLKYQIADGCEIDQMLGQWHANICGLGDIFDKDQRKTALKSMVKNNFKDTLRNFANMWRVFALNDEGGTVICDYPEGSVKPVIPIPYCEECMTGFEYAFAGLLISEGFVEDGIKVVRAIRDRYDGQKRNPWNEIECGSNYARAMSSFALLPIFSGFEYDMTKNHIGFSPVLNGDYRCFWSLGTAWGDYIRKGCENRIIIKEGILKLCSIKASNVKALYADKKEVNFIQNGDTVMFDAVTVKRELKYLLEK